MKPPESPPQNQEKVAEAGLPEVQTTSSDGDSQCESQETAKTYVSSEELPASKGTGSLAKTRRVAGNSHPECSRQMIGRRLPPLATLPILAALKVSSEGDQAHGSREACDVFCLNCLANSAQVHTEVRRFQPGCALSRGLETRTEHRGNESSASIPLEVMRECFYTPSSAPGEQCPSRSSSEADDLPGQFYQKYWSDLTDSEHGAAQPPPQLPATKQPGDSLVNTLPHHVQALYTDSVGYVAWEECPVLVSFLQEYEGVCLAC